VRDTALAIHKKLAEIRGILKLSSSDKISATTKLRAFIAIANYDFFVTHDKTKIAIEKFKIDKEGEPDEIYALEEMTAIKLRLPGGFEWKPDEIMESLVDGIELPIRVVLQPAPSLSGNPRLNLVQWNEASRELNLGILYRFAEDLWDDCLWNSYRMIDKGPAKAFLPQDIDALRAHRIGLARRSALSINFRILGEAFMQNALAAGAKLKVREVSGIERRGKRQIIKLAKHGSSTAAFRELSVLQAYASEPYYGDLLTERLESIQGLTLSALISAWTVISRAALVLVQSIGEKHAKNVQDDRMHQWLPNYVATLQVDALVDAVASATGISAPESRRTIEFFTFRGTPGQEIWAQPLVPVGPETVAPIFAAVVSPNLRRLVDVWMRQAGVDLGRRGPAFEAHIRKLVAEAIRGSKILSLSAICIESDYTFAPKNGRDEQIDLLFSIGNTVFVAETKCILEPTDTKGIAMHRKTVLGAAEQVLRKVKALDDNRVEFTADSRRFGMALTEDFKITPLVIVSTSTHVGVSALTVPVVDEFILERFLAGELEDIAFQPSDPDSSKRFKTVFYATAAEAEERAPDYFSSPPQLQRFVEGVRGRVVPIHAASDADWIAYVVTLECFGGGVPISLKQNTAATADSAPTTTTPPSSQKL